MTRANKNPAVATVHRDVILKAAKELFIQKGFAESTIDDISRASGYSRRTLYAYFTSKEDMLHNIVADGLETLKEELTIAITVPKTAPEAGSEKPSGIAPEAGSEKPSGAAPEDFVPRFRAVFQAMHRYFISQPLSAKAINSPVTATRMEKPSEASLRIFALGNKINALLTEFLSEGIRTGAVRNDINPALSVQIFWSSAAALFNLIDAKSPYMTEAFGMTPEEIAEYGFRQLANSLLEERI